jgi:hypothetical protein
MFFDIPFALDLHFYKNSFVNHFNKKYGNRKITGI